MDTPNHQDILDAIHALRVAFVRHQLLPPAILLESHEEGMRFMTMMFASKEYRAVLLHEEMYRVVMSPDSSVWREFCFYGVTVRWPAMRTALPNGGWEYA